CCIAGAFELRDGRESENRIGIDLLRRTKTLFSTSAVRVRKYSVFQPLSGAVKVDFIENVWTRLLLHFLQQIATQRQLLYGNFLGDQTTVLHPAPNTARTGASLGGLHCRAHQIPVANPQNKRL